MALRPLDGPHVARLLDFVWKDVYTEDGSFVRFPDGLDTDDAASDWGISGPPGSPTPGSANGPPW